MPARERRLLVGAHIARQKPVGAQPARVVQPAFVVRRPLDLAVAITIEVEEPPEPAENASEKDPEGDPGSEDGDSDATTPQGRAVIVGDSDFITDSLVGAPVANLDLFLNMVNWIAEDEDLISIRPREPEDRRLFLNAQQQNNVKYLSLLFIPGFVLVVGISVWWGRR